MSTFTTQEKSLDGQATWDSFSTGWDGNGTWDGLVGFTPAPTSKNEMTMNSQTKNTVVTSNIPKN